MIGFHLYFFTRPGTLGFEQPFIPIVLGLIISFFLFNRTYHSIKLSGNIIAFVHSLLVAALKLFFFSYISFHNNFIYYRYLKNIFSHNVLHMLT